MSHMLPEVETSNSSRNDAGETKSEESEQEETYAPCTAAFDTTTLYRPPAPGHRTRKPPAARIVKIHSESPRTAFRMEVGRRLAFDV